MSKTYLDGVNAILLRVNEISGDANVLTSFVDSARQHPIDVAKQVINEGIDELFLASHNTLPREQAESTLVLVTGQREYTLATDFAMMLDEPMIDRANTTFLFKYPKGYNGLLLLDPEQNDTGLPEWFAINDITDALHLDRAPTTAEAGRTYYYQYERDMQLTTETSAMPFRDTVFRALVPAWVQLYKREMRNEFDDVLYKMSMGRAARAVSEFKQRTSYSPRINPVYPLG